MLPNPRKNTMGRPTKYKPEYCGLVEQWGKDGKSKSEMCSLLNVGRATLHDWERDFPEFAASLSRAREHSQAWWEGKAQKSLGRRHFQAQLWRYSMAGRFKEDYAELKGSESNGLDLGALVGAISQGVAAATLQAGQPGDRAKVINAEPAERDAPPRPLDVVGKGR
jgi:hypothetical protein